MIEEIPFDVAEFGHLPDRYGGEPLFKDEAEFEAALARARVKETPQVRAFFNPNHDRRGRFAGGPGGAAGGSFVKTRDAHAAAIERAVDADNPQALEAAAKKFVAAQPNVGDTIHVHHHGKLRKATVEQVNADFSIHARLHHNGASVKIPPPSRKTLVGLAAVGLHDVWAPDGTPPPKLKGLKPVSFPTAMLTQRRFFNPRHDPHSGRFAPRPGGGTSIGVTPYRGDKRSATPAGQTEINKITPYMGTARYKGFEKAAHDRAAADGVKFVSGERVGGYWEGTLEPSAALRVRGSKAATKRYALDMAKRYDQDAVAAFTPRKGGSVRRYRWKVSDNYDPQGGASALKAAGAAGATIHGHSIELIDFDGSAAPVVGQLRHTLGKGSVSRGDGALWFKGSSYAAIMIVTQWQS